MEGHTNWTFARTKQELDDELRMITQLHVALQSVLQEPSPKSFGSMPSLEPTDLLLGKVLEFPKTADLLYLRVVGHVCCMSFENGVELSQRRPTVVHEHLFDEFMGVALHPRFQIIDRERKDVTSCCSVLSNKSQFVVPQLRDALPRRPWKTFVNQDWRNKVLVEEALIIWLCRPCEQHAMHGSIRSTDFLTPPCCNCSKHHTGTGIAHDSGGHRLCCERARDASFAHPSNRIHVPGILARSFATNPSAHGCAAHEAVQQSVAPW
mmetsp:Transcript_37309/g.79242  ORF Transcript_37309/g.79242 Transcript_37309/m.79242 type:complete len:265 (-) Transcript_37309:258-1052(-)